MNDDGVPDSVDDVLAKAARMGRAPASAKASPQPDHPGLQVSLAAVASHARSAAAEAAGKSEREAQKAAKPTVDPKPVAAPAVWAAPPVEPQPEHPVAAAAGSELPVSAPVEQTTSVQDQPPPAPAIAEGFTPTSEEIAALHDKFVQLDEVVQQAAPVVVPIAAPIAAPITAPAVAPAGVREAEPMSVPAASAAPEEWLEEKTLKDRASEEKAPEARAPEEVAPEAMAPEAKAFEEQAPVTAAVTAPAAVGLDAPHAVARPPRPRRAALAATAAVLVLGVVALVGLQHKSDPARPPVQLARSDAPRAAPVPATPTAAVPAPSPAVPVDATPVTPPPAIAEASAAVPTPPTPAEDRPALGVVIEQADAGNTALAEQLAASTRVDGQQTAEDAQASGWLAGLVALAHGPRVAVVRYDALQAARSAPASQRVPALEVVAPLTLEPIYFVVRADSPLRFVHEIRGKAINVGAAQGSRALTIDTLYRGLFDAPVPAHPLRAQEETAALDHLAAGRLDVVALVGIAPRAGFVRTSAAQGGQASQGSPFRLLAFDATKTVSRSALNNFLPMQAAPGSLGAFPEVRTPTLGTMSFVVTARQSSRSGTNGGKAGGDHGSASNGSNSNSNSGTSNSSDDHARAIARLADELCGVRGGLQRVSLQGQQRVDPALQLDVGWPYSAAAQAAFSRCGAAGAGAAARASATARGSS